MTHKDYLDGKVTHEEYYRSINAAAGIRGTPMDLARVRAALASGDVHLNTIPLAQWDDLARVVGPRLVSSFKKHGDYVTLGGVVCALKQAAKDAANSDEPTA